MSTYKTKKDENGNYICLFCNKIITDKKRKRYCNDECSNAKWTQNSHAWLRSKLLHESKHTCQKCGKKPRKPFTEPDGAITHYLDDSKLILDHKIPIALGGPEFDEKNLWILCDICNKAKTAEDAKNIAKHRRREKGRRDRWEHEPEIPPIIFHIQEKMDV
jgi:5-methylcytosine-specific restriction endonuclease McrA